MNAIWMRARNELARRRRGWIAISLMVAVAGGVVMAAAEGARRSDTAVPRFLAYAGATHADIEADPSQFREIGVLPEVESATAGAYMLMGSSLTRQVRSQVPVSVIAIADPVLHGRPLVIAGHMADLNNPGEAIIDENALQTGALRLGQTVTLQGFTFDQMDAVLRGTTEEPKGPSATVTIVGVIRVPTDLSTTAPPPGVTYTGNAELIITPALYKQVGTRTANFLGLSVRLKHGNADIPALTRDVSRITQGHGAVHAGSDDLQAGAEAQRATHTEAQALWLFALFGAIAAVLIIGQSISRQFFLGSNDSSTLFALGMSRGQLLLSALLCLIVVTVVGAIVAAGIAILLSPLTPIGLARKAEVDIGFHLDLPVLLIGVAGCIVVFTARAVFPAWRSSSIKTVDDRLDRPRRVADAAARAGMPATTVTGVQMALDPGKGRTAVPVRTAIAGTVVAVGVLAASVVFGASLDHLGASPRLQGWTWDVTVGNPHSDDVSATAIPTLQKNADVAAFSAEEFDGLETAAHAQVIVLGLDQIAGHVGPPILEGRAPNGPDEIALGTKALLRLHKRIGDSITLGGPTGKVKSFRVVGRALITPVIINGQVTMGDGGWIQQPSLRALVPYQGGEEGAVNVFLIKFKEGIDRRAAIATLKRDFPGTVLTPYAPAEVENLRRIDTLPFILAIMLGLLAIATIAHALATSVRRRRSDLAVLKTLGFVRSQVTATVAWQASTLAVIAAVVGLAAGVAGGRWLWVFFAGRLGLHPAPAIPLLLLVFVVPGAVLIANLTAAVPARAAARTQPALVLRAE